MTEFSIPLRLIEWHGSTFCFSVFSAVSQTQNQHLKTTMTPDDTKSCNPNIKLKTKHSYIAHTSIRIQYISYHFHLMSETAVTLLRSMW